MNLITGMDTNGSLQAVAVTTSGEVKVVSSAGTAVIGKVIISQSAGNPSGTITRPANTTAYAAGDGISTAAGANLTFATGLTAGSKFAIYSARIRSDDAAAIAGATTYKLHLFNAAPTAIADNAAHAVVTADAAKYLGYITLSAMEDVGDFINKRTDEINAVMSLAAAGTSIYGQLQTVGAFTPASGTVYTIELVLGAL